MCHMFFMYLYKNAPPHHIFPIKRNHSLRSPKLNHNIFNGCKQGVISSWPFLSNPKCIVDYIHLNTSLQCYYDFFLSTPHNLTTFLLLPIDEPEASVHTMFLATTSWVFLGPTKWLVIKIILELNGRPSSVNTFSTGFSFQNLKFKDLFEV